MKVWLGLPVYLSGCKQIHFDMFFFLIFRSWIVNHFSFLSLEFQLIPRRPFRQLQQPSFLPCIRRFVKTLYNSNSSNILRLWILHNSRNNNSIINTHINSSIKISPRNNNNNNNNSFITTLSPLMSNAAIPSKITTKTKPKITTKIWRKNITKVGLKITTTPKWKITTIFNNHNSGSRTPLTRQTIEEKTQRNEYATLNVAVSVRLSTGWPCPTVVDRMTVYPALLTFIHLDKSQAGSLQF